MAAILTQILGYRLFPGELMNQIIGVCNNLTGNGTAQAVTGTTGAFSGNVSGGGTFTLAPQILATAGSTQGSATAITKSLAIVTANTTASTHGVRLPTAATGLMVWVVNAATTFAFKVYPATNGKIGAAATNVTDTVLAKNKANLYIARNTTYWAVQRGS
jgi:hypothetical protein